MKQLIQKHEQKLRFGAVGLVNTAVDFGVYTLLTYFFGLPIFIANFISTASAGLVSFFANRRFTFDSKNKRKFREFIRFWIVTLAGAWLVQPTIIFATKTALTSLHLTNLFLVIIPKALAIIAVLIWNYLWYSRYVFAGGKQMPDDT